MTAPVSAPTARGGQLVPKLIAVIGIVAVIALLYLAVSWVTSVVEWIFGGSSPVSPLSLSLKALGLPAVV